jgi:hypothetical protein
MKAQAFFTADTRSLISLPIMSSTGGKYAHTGILFTCSSHEFLVLQVNNPDVDWSNIPTTVDNKCRFYFESVSRKDAITKKSGVRGPYPLHQICKWHHENPKTHKFELLNINCDNIDSMIPFLITATREIKYAYGQIWRNWLTFRWRKGTPLHKRSSDKWTCSETVARTVAHADGKFAVRVLKLGEFLFDDYAPSSSKGAGLYELLKGRGA